MKKYALVFTLFASIIIICFLGCMHLDGQTPALSNGSPLPADISDRSYLLTDLFYDEQLGGYPIRIPVDSVDGSLAIICMTRIATIIQEGRTFYTLDENSPYSRTVVASIASDLSSGQIEFLLVTKAIRSNTPSLFRNVADNAPQIIIGSQQNIEGIAKTSSELVLFLIGMYAVIAYCGLVLFFKKKSERYLLYIGIVPSIALLTTLLTTGVGPINITYKQYIALRPWLFIVPVTLNTTICLYLFSEDLPPKLKKWIRSSSIFLLATVAIIIQSTTTLVTYHLVRRICWIPMLIAFANSLSKHRTDSVFLFIAFAASEGIALYMHRANLIGSVGVFSVCIRLTELGNILFLSACMAFVLNRFAEKFKETEHLSEELQHLNTHLTDIVSERTQQLETQQEQKHSLMLNIFHDLRSPIFIIRERLTHLKPTDEEDAEAIAVIDTRLGYMQTLTEELFLSAKLENNAVLFEEDLVQLDKMLARLARDNASAAKKRNIVLSYTYTDDGPCSTWGDSLRLEQAVQNLISNALAFTPDGGSVSITLEKEESTCRIRIKDTGIGISEEALPKVFDRYYRINPQNHSSSGLGLSIVRDIIAAHRGKVEVYSKINEGSEFIIILNTVEPE